MKLNFWKKEDSSVSAGADATVSLDEQKAELYPIDPPDPEKAKFYNNISRWALYIGVFLLPLFFLPWTSSPLELNKQMLLLVVASVGLVSWLLGVVSSGYLAWRPNYVDKGVLALLGAFVVSAIFSVFKFHSLFGLNVSLSNSIISIASLVVLYFLIVDNSEDRGRGLRSLLGLSVTVVLLIGLLQIFGANLFRFVSFGAAKSFNTVGSVNVLGMLAALCLPMFSKSRFDAFGWMKNAHVEKIGVVLSLLLLVILNWWVYWILAIVGMVAIIVFENLGGGKLKIKKLILPMTVVIVGVFMMVVDLDLQALKKDLPVELVPSYGLSTDIAVSALKEKPIFGYGLENFSFAFDKYGASRLANTNLAGFKFFDSTAEIITMVVSGGAVMAVAFLFFLWSVFMVFWKYRGYVNRDLEQSKEDFGVLASFVATIVALFLYPFNLTLMMFFFVIMGLAVLILSDNNRKEYNIEEKTSLSLSASLGFIGGLILVLVGVYFGTTIYIGDVKYAEALKVTDKAVIAETLVTAINWNGNDDRYFRSASQAALGLLADEVNKKADAERNAKIQNYISTATSLARRATEISPMEAENWANLGFVYQNLLAIVDGADKLAENAYLRASELRPGDPTFAYRTGMLYFGKLDLLAQLVASRRITAAQANSVALEAVKKSEEYLRKAVEQAPSFGLAIYNLGVVYDRQGKVGDAIKELEKVAPANSDQPGLAFELGLLYYRAGRKAEAKSALERAIVLSPDYSNARWYLALILEEGKNLDGAIEQLERILSVEVNKDNKVVLDKIEQLKAGKTSFPPGDILDEKPLE